MRVQYSTILIVPPVDLQKVSAEVLNNCFVVVRPLSERGNATMRREPALLNALPDAYYLRTLTPASILFFSKSVLSKGVR